MCMVMVLLVNVLSMVNQSLTTLCYMSVMYPYVSE